MILKPEIFGANCPKLLKDYFEYIVKKISKKYIDVYEPFNESILEINCRGENTNTHLELKDLDYCNLGDSYSQTLAGFLHGYIPELDKQFFYINIAPKTMYINIDETAYVITKEIGRVLLIRNEFHTPAVVNDNKDYIEEKSVEFAKLNGFFNKSIQRSEKFEPFLYKKDILYLKKHGPTWSFLQ